MLHGRNGMEVKWLRLCGISKHIGLIVIRLKAIKCKEDFSCYLSVSFRLSPQAHRSVSIIFQPWS